MRSQLDEQDSSRAAAAPDRVVSTRPPWPLVAIAVVALALAIFVTPENLDSTWRLLWRSAEPASDDSAWLRADESILLFRVLCLITAVATPGWIFFRKKIIESAFVRRILSHTPENRGWTHSRDALLNFSLYASIACAAVGLIYLSFGERFFTPDQWVFMNIEDGVVEYATAIFFFVCFAMSSALAFKNRASAKRASAFLLLASAFLFVSGEEISWGQRVLGISTPHSLKKINDQNELNLHNILNTWSNKLFLISVFVYGVAFPLLAWRRRFFRNLFDYLRLPIASLGLATGFFIMLCFDLHILPILVPMPEVASIDGHPVVDELRELLISICFFLLMIEAWRKAPEDRQPAPAASA